MRHVLAALALISLAGAPAKAADDCISDWSLAAGVVRKESLATVEQLLQLAKKVVGGAIVRTTLCQEGGAYVYRIVVKEPGGRLKTVTVDARKPFGR